MLWDPFLINRLLAPLPEHMRREAFQRTDARLQPAVRVFTRENELLVTAELPGVAREDLELSVEEDRLTLRGTYPESPIGEGQKLYIKERPHRNFERSLRLPFRAQVDGIEASLSRGVLEIRVPRLRSEQPKRIEIKIEPGNALPPSTAAKAEQTERSEG